MTSVSESSGYASSSVSSTPGVRGVVIGDRDGVPILRVHDETVPETAFRPGFLSSVGFATDQASKLGHGKARHIISIHERHQVTNWQRERGDVMVSERLFSHAAQVFSVIDRPYASLGKVILASTVVYSSGARSQIYCQKVCATAKNDLIEFVRRVLGSFYNFRVFLPDDSLPHGSFDTHYNSGC